MCVAYSVIVSLHVTVAYNVKHTSLLLHELYYNAAKVYCTGPGKTIKEKMKKRFEILEKFAALYKLKTLY